METVPPGPDADDTAKSVRARLLQEVKERRTPRTNASRAPSELWPVDSRPSRPSRAQRLCQLCVAGQPLHG